MQPIVRFAPSPTGLLHIGGARTALYNYLYAKRHNGKFLLRIEDTDRVRSTDTAIQAIYDGLQWLGIHCDGEPAIQSKRADRHREVATQLLATNKAYRCYCPAAKDRKKDDRKCDCRLQQNSDVRPFVVRLAVYEGITTVADAVVTNTVTIDHSQLDDIVLLRSDSTPTYMLSVVVDDHDAGVTLVMRGNDHYTNTFRQIQIYDACGWEKPQFAHIPLIHGQDGAKLSKRHGAVGVGEYRSQGILPEAMCNYLLRLGWSHGNDEIITMADAQQWFDIEHISRSSSRFDMANLLNINSHYLRSLTADQLLVAVGPFLPIETIKTIAIHETLLRGLPIFAQRAKTLCDFARLADFCWNRPSGINDAMQTKFADVISSTDDDYESIVKQFVIDENSTMAKVCTMLRLALTGQKVSPSIGDVIYILGKEEALKRLYCK